MGRYQCQNCLREFVRSDSLRRHLARDICKQEDAENESAEEPQDETEEERDETGTD